jgi:hypothetical protein
MTVRYMPLEDTIHPYELSEMDKVRVQAVTDGELDIKWVSSEELEAFEDLVYDHIAEKIQTHEGSLCIQ